MISRLLGRSFSSKAAIVLSGCGVYDGSEITESVSILIHLSKRGVEYDVFAPNKDQADVINTNTGQPSPQKRNAMIESARIARGNVKSLTQLNSAHYGAIFIPGGFGAAKNLSNFASQGEKLEVDSDLQNALVSFHTAKKPIALCCIAPVIAAKVFEGKGISLTLGSRGDSWPYAGSIDAATSLGSKVELKNIDEVSVDKQNKIVTSPAYMKGDAKPNEVFEGIGKMVEQTLALL